MSKPLIFDIPDGSSWSLETENHALRRQLRFYDQIVTALAADLEATKKELETYKNGKSTEPRN